MKYSVNFDIELKKNTYGGMYIALEGIDGSGKTTQVQRVADYYRKQGKEVVITREPRKEGFIGDLVQKILRGEAKLPAVAIQYLFSADRAAQHQELVIPALKEDKVVITDRCFWSAIVYGILDRTGGRYDKNDADLLLISQSILSMYHQFIIPDKTFYLKISLETAIQRIGSKKEKKEIYEDRDKLKKVIGGYGYLLDRFPDEITVIDGEKSEEKVTKEIIANLK